MGADGTFHLQTFYSGGDLADCSGDAGKEQKCGLMGGLLGSLTFDPLSFPVKKGSTSVSVDLSLSSLIPAALAQTETKVTASTKVEINSSAWRSSRRLRAAQALHRQV